jgi:hypothetical protein
LISSDLRDVCQSTLAASNFDHTHEIEPPQASKRDKVSLRALQDTRQQYQTPEAAILALQQLDPSQRVTGNYESVTKRLAKVLHALQTEPAAPLKCLTAESVNSVPEPILFYKNTFNYIDLIDRYAAWIEWPSNVCRANMLIIIYLLRLAIINIHAVVQEAKMNDRYSGNTVPAGVRSQNANTAVQQSSLRETVTSLQQQMQQFEHEILGHSSKSHPLSTINRSPTNSTTISPNITGAKRKRMQNEARQ